MIYALSFDKSQFHLITKIITKISLFYFSSISFQQQILVSSPRVKKINTKWKQDVITVAEGKRPSNGLNQLPSLSSLQSVYVDDDDQRIYTADYWNHRIVGWKCGAKNVQVVAGRNGSGDRINQLRYLTDVIVNHKTDSLIICDSRNR